MFEQCSKRATRSVPQIYPKRSGSPSSAGRARNPATPQTTAVERVRLVEKMARGEKNPAATLRAKERRTIPAAKKLAQRKGQQSLAYLAIGLPIRRGKEAKNGTSGTLVRCDELPNIVRRRRRNFWDGTRSQSGQS